MKTLILLFVSLNALATIDPVSTQESIRAVKMNEIIQKVNETDNLLSPSGYPSKMARIEVSRDTAYVVGVGEHDMTWTHSGFEKNISLNAADKTKIMFQEPGIYEITVNVRNHYDVWTRFFVTKNGGPMVGQSHESGGGPNGIAYTFLIRIDDPAAFYKVKFKCHGTCGTLASAMAGAKLVNAVIKKIDDL